MCDEVVSNDPFMLKYYPDRYKTQKCVPDWFVTFKMIKKFDDDLLSNDDIIFDNKDSYYDTFFSVEMGILGIDLNDINNDDVNLDEDDLETIIHATHMAGCITFNQCKAFKKDISKELMSVAWHPTRWWDWCMKEDNKIDVNAFLLIKSSVKMLVLF